MLTQSDRSGAESLLDLVLGDGKYGSCCTLGPDRIALMCRSLTLVHPTRDEVLTFTAEEPEWWPWGRHNEEKPMLRLSEHGSFFSLLTSLF